MLTLLILIAKPLFVILFTERWLASVPYFQILCIGGMAGCLQAVNQQTIAAIGESRVFFIWTIIKNAVGIALQVVGLIVCGMWGLLAGKVMSSWLSYFVNISLVSKYVGYKFFQQLKDLAPIFIVSVLALFLGFFCSSILGLSLFPDGLIRVLVFTAIYVGWSVLFKADAFRYFSTALAELKKKRL